MPNVSQGTRRNISWTAFNFHFTRYNREESIWGIWEDSSSENQTIAYAQLRNFSFPGFSMRVRNVSNVINNNFTGEAIDFMNYHRSSKTYRVRG